MLKFIIKRILLSLLILIGVSIIIYTLIRLMPTDYVENMMQGKLLSGDVTMAQIEAMKELYGLNGSVITGYWNWLMQLLQGNLGHSFVYGKPVADVIGSQMWISFTLASIALIFQVIISIPLGIVSATKQYGALDYNVTVFAMMGISLPSFFFAALLMRVFSLGLGWFPLQGLTDATVVFAVGDTWGPFIDKMMHLVLPITVLVVLSIGGLMRYTRTNMLEVLNADYIRTARAKGLSEHTVTYKHAFRNTMIPLVTMLGGTIPGLFGGAMITETVFAIPGIGQIAYKAVILGDVPFIMGYNMFLAVLTVIGTIIADLLYVVVDPRVRLE